MHFFAHDVLAVIGKLLVSYFFHHIALRFSMEHHKRVSINAPFYGGTGCCFEQGLGCEELILNGGPL